MRLFEMIWTHTGWHQSSSQISDCCLSTLERHAVRVHQRGMHHMPWYANADDPMDELACAGHFLHNSCGRACPAVHVQQNGWCETVSHWAACAKVQTSKQRIEELIVEDMLNVPDARDEA